MDMIPTRILRYIYTHHKAHNDAMKCEILDNKIMNGGVFPNTFDIHNVVLPRLFVVSRECNETNDVFPA